MSHTLLRVLTASDGKIFEIIRNESSININCSYYDHNLTPDEAIVLGQSLIQCAEETRNYISEKIRTDFKNQQDKLFCEPSDDLMEGPF